MQAIHNGEPDGVRQAIAAGASVNAKLGDESTALLWCLERSKPEMLACLDHLLAAGVDTNQCNHEGTSPLMKACWNGEPKAVERLLAAGADPNHQDNEGFSVVMSIAGNRLNMPANLELLLAAGADVHARSKTGSTAWIVFARKGHRGALERLLEHGADPTVQDNVGNHAWELVGNQVPERDQLAGWLKSQAQAWQINQTTPVSEQPRPTPRL